MRVLVTGSSGLCGSAIQEESVLSDHHFYFATRSMANLESMSETSDLFRRFHPECVIHAAAKVGGVGMNRDTPYSLCSKNLRINQNIIQCCVNYEVEQLMAFSSVCVFPDNIDVLEEGRMHEGPAYDGTFGYAYSKRMVDTLIKAVSVEYGKKNWTSVIPGNLYGKSDLFDEVWGHCIPSLISRLYHAKKRGEPLNVWGDGESRREFIYVNDLARILVDSIGRELPERIIISGEKENSIREVVELLGEIAEHKGIIWGGEMNGQRSRPTSKRLFNQTFPSFKYTDLRSGLTETWNWFCENYPNVRAKY